MGIADKPLRLHPCLKTLLQCLYTLRPAKDPPRPLPLAPQTVVSRTETVLYSSRPQRAQHSVLVLLPSAARRSQLTRHVHPRHGIRDIHTPLHATRRSSGSVPSRGDGSDGHRCLCGCSRGDSGAQIRDVHIEHKQRQPIARPRRIFRIQIRGGHCHTGSS